jgi:hypothetical protein
LLGDARQSLGRTTTAEGHAEGRGGRSGRPFRNRN